MYQLFGLKALLTALVPIVVFLGFALSMLFPPKGLGEMVSLASTTGTISIITLVLLGQSPVFHWFWKKTWVQQHFFPYIHGKWEGKIQSNWSVISAIRGAATSQSNAVDVNALDMHTVGSVDKDVSVEIDATFLHITMKLIPKDNYTDSETIFVRPEKRGDGGYPSLYYMYRSIANTPLGTDVSVHYGAARMDIKSTAAGTHNIVGNYWTERNWHKGMNTAGYLNVDKID